MKGLADGEEAIALGAAVTPWALQLPWEQHSTQQLPWVLFFPLLGHSLPEQAVAAVTDTCLHLCLQPAWTPFQYFQHYVCYSLFCVLVVKIRDGLIPDGLFDPQCLQGWHLPSLKYVDEKRKWTRLQEGLPRS